MLGLAQSGFPRLRVASLQIAAHRDLAVRARAHAEALLDADGRMEPPRPALTAELERAGSAGWRRASRRAARDGVGRGPGRADRRG